MTSMRPIVLALALLGGGLATLPTNVIACGGCFAPPGAASVVTDHRMVLALSTTQTTLWDQFQYSGMPEDFSWILPIRYTDRTRVQLASDDFLTLLNNVLVPALVQPSSPGYPPGCVFPSPPGGFADAAAVDAPSSSDSGVTVLREEVVGPYAVAIVRGTTGMGLRDWLRMNGYSVPAAVEPVIDHYLGLSMDFIALRLRAGKGLNRMVPVRVTLDGYQPRLPLRMIAAGVADRVGLSLTVFASARIEAMNFPNTELTNDDFTYDWNMPPGDFGGLFQSVFAARNRAMGDRVWLTESAMRQDHGSLRSTAMFLPRRMGFGGDAGFTDGGAAPSAVDDVDTAFMGLGTSAMVTRMRADLPARMLDRDLDLAASDRGERNRFYQFGRELNRPAFQMCPFPVDGGIDSGVPVSDIGTGPTDIGAPPSDAGTTDPPDSSARPPLGDGSTSVEPMPAEAQGGIRCAVSVPGEGEIPVGALVAGVALSALMVRRRRTSR